MEIKPTRYFEGKPVAATRKEALEMGWMFYEKTMRSTCGCDCPQRTSSGECAYCSRDRASRNHYKNREKRLEQKRLYYEETRDDRLMYEREYRKENPGASGSRSRRRRAKNKQALVPWYDLVKEEVRAINDRRRELERQTGEEYHIDHIIPFHGYCDGKHVVCGIDLPQNLRPSHWRTNISKSNKLYWHGLPFQDICCVPLDPEVLESYSEYAIYGCLQESL